MARTLTETLQGPGRGRLDAAVSLLKQHGARFVDEALRDNPDGPIAMHTEISRMEITYDVVIGCPEDSMSTRAARGIWSRIVPFGASDAHCSGGSAFVEAARAQEAVAWAALEVMEARR